MSSNKGCWQYRWIKTKCGTASIPDCQQSIHLESDTNCSSSAYREIMPKAVTRLISHSIFVTSRAYLSKIDSSADDGTLKSNHFMWQPFYRPLKGKRGLASRLDLFIRRHPLIFLYRKQRANNNNHTDMHSPEVIRGQVQAAASLFRQLGHLNVPELVGGLSSRRDGDQKVAINTRTKGQRQHR